MYTRVPENGLLRLMYNLYASNNMSVKLDVGKLLTNCNQYLLDVVDKSSTSGLVSCIPIAILKKISPDLHQSSEWTDEEYKNKLLIEAEKVDPSLQTSYSIYYKPIFTKPVVTNVGWEYNPALNNALETTPIPADINKSNRNLWLSNINLSALMKSYTLLRPSTIFLGVTFLSCFDGFNDNDMANIYNTTALYHEFEKQIADTEWDCCLAFIVSYSHWSSLILDKKRKRCYHFCSGGNNPSHYNSSKKMIFYSSARSFIKPSGTKIHRHIATKNAIFKQLMNHGYTIYMNVESCQMVSGECGMFAAMFLIFFCIEEIASIDSVKALYNSFAFLGDKTVGMYKDLLFWRSPNQDVRTRYVNITEEWKKIISEQTHLNSQLSATVLLDEVALNRLSGTP